MATLPVSAGTQKTVQPAVLKTHHNNPIWWSLTILDLHSFALSRSYEGFGRGETSVWGPEQLHIPGVYPQIPAGPDPVVHPEAWIWTQGGGQRARPSTYSLHKPSVSSRPLRPPHFELNLVLLFALRVTSHSSQVTRWGDALEGQRTARFFLTFSETYFLTLLAEGVLTLKSSASAWATNHTAAGQIYQSQTLKSHRGSVGIQGVSETHQFKLFLHVREFFWMSPFFFPGKKNNVPLGQSVCSNEVVYGARWRLTTGSIKQWVWKHGNHPCTPPKTRLEHSWLHFFSKSLTPTVAEQWCWH